MGVLFFAADLKQPSQLWMQRMLEGLGSDVSMLVDTVEPGPELRARHNVMVFPPVVGRGVPGLRWYRQRRHLRAQVSRLVSAMSQPEIDCALVHYLTIGVRFADVWRRVEKPVFVHCHGWDVTWDRRSLSGPGAPTHDRHYVRRARELPANVRFIANSHATKRRLEQIGIDAGRIIVKYLGVPFDGNSPLVPTRPSTCLNLLFLGRLVDFKGPDLLIRAFLRACELGLDGCLKIAGDGPMRGECKALRDASGFANRIHLLGAVSELEGNALRADADIFTAHNQMGPQTRQEEAFGVAYVEAMAAGLPIVTGRNGSLPEIIEHGEEGLLVTPGDIEAHARAFIDLARNPEERQRMGRNARVRALRQFSLQREMEQLREILALAPVPADAVHPSQSPGVIGS